MEHYFGADGPYWVIVTDFCTVRVHEDTRHAFRREYPRMPVKRDRRFKAWKAMEHLERDVSAIAEIEYLHGGLLTEF